MTIEMMLLAGAAAGLLIGVIFRNPRLGCGMLWIVPIAMIAYVYAWQSAHPENIRSTSGLDFIFGPLWPSLGAAAGWVVGTIVRHNLWRDGS